MTMAIPQNAEIQLFKDGFFWVRDIAIGEDIAEMERRYFPYYSDFGLEFCRRHVLNERIHPIITNFFEHKECVLAHWLRYKKYPGHILCFRSGGLKAGRRRLMVQLFAKGSKVAYWKHAHEHELPTTEGERLLHEIEESDLLAAGCERIEEEFLDGGIAVFDGRVAFELREGYAITFEFATIDIIERLERWPKMTLPNTPGLADKVAAMQLPNIRINFAFKDPAEDTTHEPSA